MISTGVSQHRVLPPVIMDLSYLWLVNEFCGQGEFSGRDFGQHRSVGCLLSSVVVVRLS